MLCVRASARAPAAAPPMLRPVGGVAAAQGLGAAGRMAWLAPRISQGQKSHEICETEMLGFFRTDGLRHQPKRPSPLSLGSRVGSGGG